MFYLRRQILLIAYMVVDLVIMILSFALAAKACNFRYQDIQFEGLIFLLGFTLIWHLIFNLLGIYRSKRFTAKRLEALDLFKATFLGSLILLGALSLFNIQLANLVFITVFWVGVTALTLLSRLIMRYMLARARIRGRNLRFMLIVGTNHRAIKFAQRIELKKELGYRIIGFVDNEWDGIEPFRKTNNQLITDFESFPSFIRNNVVDEVIICLPMKSFYDQAFRIVTICEEQGIIARFLPNIFDLKFARATTESFEGESMITISTGGMEGWPVLVKRLFDVLFSLTLFIVLLPLFLIVSILIKITSPGPVFFVQDRVGLNKRKIRLYKFRTMRPDAEEQLKELEQFNEVSGPVFKIKNDPRITKLGKILRKTSIDELPQLLNVLKGDMSLVGPRPLPLRDFAGFDQDWHRRRFSVRPGLTCLWQINGRNAVPFEKWMALDMEYIDKWSNRLDFKILLKTIPTVLKASGAA
ncbi:MAG: sugar transferase [Deltaproteobacteria bacterium]|nr:sugar transferase [Deltaproteobacteria bacterium]